MDDEIADIRIVLMRWGQSRSMNDAYEIDYPHKSPYCEDMRNSGGWAARVRSLKDTNHEVVDRHVSELKQRTMKNDKDLRYKAICLAYIEKMKDKSVGNKLGCSTSRAREARIAGENWLEAKVEINLWEL